MVAVPSPRPPPPSLLERFLRTLEAGLEVVLWSEARGTLTAHRADRRFNRSDLAGARALYRVVAENPAAAESVVARVRLYEAAAAFTEGLFPTALEALRRCDHALLPVQLRQQRFSLYAALGSLTRDVELVRDVAAEWIAVEPTERMAHLCAAWAAKNAGQLRAALIHVDQAIKHAPDDAYCLLIRAAYALLNGERDAELTLRHLLLAPAPPQYTEHFWWQNVGWAHAILGDDEATYAALRTALDAVATMHEARTLLTWLDVEVDFERLRGTASWGELHAHVVARLQALESGKRADAAKPRS